MKYFKILSLFFALLLFAQCNTPLNLYKKGRYSDAVVSAVKKLRSKPDDIQAQDILAAAYPMAQQTALRLINAQRQSPNVQKHYAIVQQYVLLNNMADEIYRCPKALQIVAPQEYNSELQEAKNEAAEDFYNLGKKTLKNGDVHQARAARGYFINATYFAENYKDVAEMIKLAEFYSTLRVVVQKPLTNRNYQLSSDFFFDNLMAELRRTTKDKFVEFYAEDEAQKLKIAAPHQIITLDFLDFTVGNAKESSKTIDCKKDSVKVELSNGKYGYTTAKATLTTHTLELYSGGILNLRITDFNTNKPLRETKFSGSYTWTSAWGKYRGDDRALTPLQKKLCDKEPQTPPPPQTLFVEFTKPIYSKTVSYLNNYYLNY